MSRIFPLILSACLLLLTSCLKTVTPTPGSGNPISQVGILFLNAAPSSVPMDVYDNYVKENVSPLGYNEATPGYITLGSGLCKFSFDTSGTQQVAATITENLEANEAYSMILYDSTGGKQKTMFLLDSISNTSTILTNVRFLDLCPNVYSMNVYLNNTLLFEDRRFEDNLINFTLDTFLEVTGGDYTVTLQYLNGADTVSYKQLIRFNSGDVFTMYASGYAGATDSTALQIGFVQNY